MNLLSWVAPAPWSFLIRWAAMAAAVAAFAGYFYVKGIDHQQTADQVAEAKQREADDKFNASQAQSLYAVQTQWKQDLDDERQNRVAAERAADDFKQRMQLLLSAPARTSGAGMPAAGSDHVAGAGAAPADARAGAVLQQYLSAVVHDAGQYGTCYKALQRSRQAVGIAGGFDGEAPAIK